MKWSWPKMSIPAAPRKSLAAKQAISNQKKTNKWAYRRHLQRHTLQNWYTAIWQCWICRSQWWEGKSESLGHRRSGFRLQASGFMLQALGFRLQASGFRLQASGFRLQASFYIGANVKALVTGSITRSRSLGYVRVFTRMWMYRVVRSVDFA